MNHLGQNPYAARAMALLAMHDLQRHQQQRPMAAPWAPAPQENFGAPFLGEDYLGAELMGTDYLGADDDPLAMLGNDQIRALLGQDGFEAYMGGRRRRRGRPALTTAAPPVQAVPRDGYLPIPATLVTAASPTAIINIFPQVQGGIQITRLVIPSNQGTTWLINDVIVGTRSQFFAPGSISGVLLSEVATIKLRGDVAYPGTIVAINVTNLSGADATLLGASFVADAREARNV